MLCMCLLHQVPRFSKRNDLIESDTEKPNTNAVLVRFSLQGDEKKFEPQVMCFTQEAIAISALEMGPYNERECLIGVSQSGSVFVWSLADGQCQVSKTNGSYLHSIPSSPSFILPNA